MNSEEVHNLIFKASRITSVFQLKRYSTSDQFCYKTLFTEIYLKKISLIDNKNCRFCNKTTEIAQSICVMHSIIRTELHVTSDNVLNATLKKLMVDFVNGLGIVKLLLYRFQYLVRVIQNLNDLHTIYNLYHQQMAKDEWYNWFNKQYQYFRFKTLKFMKY